MDPDYKKAKRRVEEIKGFYWHFLIFIITGLFFLIMNIATNSPGETDFWFYYPMIPWSVGLAIHYIATFGIPGVNILSADWEQRQLAKEMSKLKYGQPEKREDYLDLTDPDPEEEQFELEDPIIQQKKWDENEFV